MLACLFTVFIVVHDVAHEFLKRLKPHPEHRAELCEPVDVAWNVEFFFFANMPDQLLCKRVTIPAERIVVLTVPKLSKLVNDLINLVPTVICQADRQAFFENEASRVTFVNDHDARVLHVVPAVRKLQIVHAHRRVVQAESKHLQTAINVGHVVDVQVDDLMATTATKLAQPLHKHIDFRRLLHHLSHGYLLVG